MTQTRLYVTALAALALLAVLLGVAAAQSLDDGTINGEITYNNTSQELLINTSPTYAYDDELHHRYPYNGTINTSSSPRDLHGDGSGSVIDGSPTQSQPGYNNGSWMFDGDDAVQLEETSLENSMTVSTWVNASSLGGSNSEDYLYTWDTRSTIGNPYTYYSRANTRWAFRDGAGTTAAVSMTQSQLEDGGWFLVVETINNSQLAGYVYDDNGSEIGNASIQDPDVDFTRQNWTVGKSPSGQRWWEGEIDELRLYDRVLNESDRRELVNDDSLPAKLDADASTGSWTSDPFNISRKTRVSLNLTAIDNASMDLRVERYDGGDWMLDNETVDVDDPGLYNVTTDGFYTQMRRVVVQYSATSGGDATFTDLFNTVTGSDLDNDQILLVIIGVLVVMLVMKRGGASGGRGGGRGRGGRGR